MESSPSRYSWDVATRSSRASSQVCSSFKSKISCLHGLFDGREVSQSDPHETHPHQLFIGRSIMFCVICDKRVQNILT